MKKLICTILCIGMVTGLFTGCGSEPKNEDVKEPAENDAQSDEKDDVEDGSQSGEPEGAKAGSDDAMKIAYLVDVLGESQMSYMDYMQEYCDYLNETEGLGIEFTYFDGQSDITKQIEQLENCVQLGYDGVIVGPVDVDGIAPAVKAAQDAGVVVLDNRSALDAANLHINNSDETLRSEQVRDWIIEYANAHPDQQFKAGIMYGAQATVACLPRGDVQKTIPDVCDNFEIVATQNCPNWTADDSMKIMEDWLQANPDMNFLITASEDIAYGAVQVLTTAGLIDDYVIVTFNGEQPGIDMMREGTIDLDNGSFVPAGSVGQIMLLVDGIQNGTTGYYDYSEYTLFNMTPDNLEEIVGMYDSVDFAEFGFPEKVSD